MKRKQYSSSKNQDLWLTSYADLISAIFAVMVLFVSFSKIDIEKFDMIQRLMIEKNKKEFDNFKTLESIEKNIIEVAKKNNLDDKILVTMDKTGLIINFYSAAQFKSGSYTLLEDKMALMLPVLNEIIEQSQYRYVDISGYTDNVAGNKISNWELSSLRALTIKKYLEKNGLNTKNVRLIAYADNQPLISYKNNVGSKEDEYIREANRRVTIIIREAKFDDLIKIKSNQGKEDTNEN